METLVVFAIAVLVLRYGCNMQFTQNPISVGLRWAIGTMVAFGLVMGFFFA